jgi:hypothetical protein
MYGSVKKVAVSKAKSTLIQKKGKNQRQADKLFKLRG